MIPLKHYGNSWEPLLCTVGKIPMHHGNVNTIYSCSPHGHRMERAYPCTSQHWLPVCNSTKALWELLLCTMGKIAMHCLTVTTIYSHSPHGHPVGKGYPMHLKTNYLFAIPLKHYGNYCYASWVRLQCIVGL